MSIIDKLINYSSINYYSPLIHKNKHFPNGFNNYQGILKIDNEFYRYIVRIGITNKNISVFYDITLEIIKKGNIHKVHQTIK